MSYRVDAVPWHLRPFFFIYGYGVGVLWFLAMRGLGLTIRVRHEGRERLTDAGYVFAMWHDENLPAFVANFFRRTGRRFILINHPLWYMKPVHVMLRLMGVEKLVLGSTGHGGRAAADQVVEYLKQGISTHINPDGPAGPPKTLKKGVLHLAAQSGAKIVPVRFTCSKAKILRSTWDGKRIPMPLSRITIHYGEPLTVPPHAIDELLEIVQRSM